MHSLLNAKLSSLRLSVQNKFVVKSIRRLIAKLKKSTRQRSEILHFALCILHFLKVFYET